MKYITTVQGREFIIEIDQENEIKVNGERRGIDFQELAEGGTLSLLIDNRSLEAIVEERDDAWEVLLHGELYTVQVQDERAYRLAQARGQLSDAAGAVVIRSPMPGLILDVLVEEGARIAKGQTVVILESMKMENELRAARDGTVTRVHVQKGDSVEKNQELVAIGEEEDDEELV
ncbi:MAG TPA: biotin/lipoyl-containing protein [Candidatus Binatia bacterium]|jgi:biotin carboxyl carrier protein|nr:biotin/lipoyl-containing protein [Candidatus Binatia bacterium]